jgi:hypothetical protein
MALELSAPIQERLPELVNAAVVELERLGYPPRPVAV